MLNLTIALVSLALGTPDTVTPAEATCSIEFTHTPVGAEVANYYPMAAFPQKVAGTATIDCIIDKNLKLTDCTVTKEEPEGYDFGSATIKYFKKNAVGKAADADGKSCVGRHTKAMFRWAFT